MQTLDDVIRNEGTGHFDQFKGKRTTFNDNRYTTSYNEADITYEQRATAERVEREILAADSLNRHQAEERG